MVLQRPNGSRIYACVFPFSWSRQSHTPNDPEYQALIDTATINLAKDIAKGITDNCSTVEEIRLSQYSTCAGPRSWIIYARLHCYINDL